MGSEDIGDVQARVLDELAGGEWTRIAPLPSPRGLMATRAFHARGRWSRRGGIEAYLKIIPEHGVGAGSSTRLLANPERLARLERRLGMLVENTSNVPSPLLTVFRLPESRALVIAMQECRPLSMIINGAPSVALGAAVLRCLSSARVSPWFHFDICPSNVAVLGSAPVFIDLESLYFAENETIQISVPAAKWNRLSPALDRELARGLGSKDGLPATSARTKHDSDCLLLAAECTLGTLLPELSAPAIGDALKTSTAEAPAQALAGSVLTRLLAGTAVEIDEFLAQLEALGNGDTPYLLTSVPPTIESSLRGQETPQKDPGNPASESLLGTGMKRANSSPQAASDVWEELAPLRRALRLEQLSYESRQGYREELRRRADQFPNDFRWVDELLLVILAFDLDPKAALEEIDRALRRFPGEERLMRRRLVAQLWVR